MAEVDRLPIVDEELWRQLALLRAAQTPLIFFEVATTSGLRGGVANITLEAPIHALAGSQIASISQVTGHLRFPVGAIPLLRKALDDIELMAQPAASSEKN